MGDRAVAAWLAVWLALGAATAPTSSPTPASGTYVRSADPTYLVTLAARACDRPSEIVGGLVRGDSQENPSPLGGVSPYRVGEPVSPEVEALHQQGCRPLVGWQFTFGGGIQKPGDLSVVTGATGVTPPTAAATPLLDATGTETGGTLPGAVTAMMSDDQVELALAGQLWVQGGTATDPLLVKDFGANELGFGTLRCGLDTHNDDNVAWVGFPAGTRHLYCFAYYVSKPPPTGTVVMRLQASTPLGYAADIPIASNLSYATGGAFVLHIDGTSADQAVFRREANRQYVATIQPPPGWGIGTVACTGGSQIASAPTDPTITVQLIPDDVTTCTYTIAPTTQSSLTIATTTANGTGKFAFHVTGPTQVDRTATTTTPDQLVAATGGPDDPLPPGTYTIAQQRVSGWTLSSVTCGGQPRPVLDNAITVDLSAAGAVCVFMNARQAPAVKLQLITTGGVGRAAFRVSPSLDRPLALEFGASVGTTTDGTVAAGPDIPAALAPGNYRLVALAPARATAGSWQLADFACVGGTATVAGDSVLMLTLSTGVVTCTAHFQFLKATQLRVIRHVAGDPNAHNSESTLAVDCLDGAAARLVMQPADTEGNLPGPLLFTVATQCRIALVKPGLVPGGYIGSEISIDGTSGPVVLPTTVDVPLNKASVVVSLTDTYSASGASPSAPLIDASSLPVKPAALIAGGLAAIAVLTLIGLMIAARRTNQRTNRQAP